MKRQSRILIVEDEARLSSLLSEALADTYVTQTARDGETALEYVALDPPDVILLDINLPRLSGLEVLKQVRTLHPRLPVIMITGTSDEVAITAALMRGAFAYVPKPFSLQYLAHLVAAAQERRAAS